MEQKREPTLEQMEQVSGGDIRSRVNGMKKRCTQCNFPLEEIGGGKYKCKNPQVPKCPMFGISTTNYTY